MSQGGVCWYTSLASDQSGNPRLVRMNCEFGKKKRCEISPTSSKEMKYR